MRPSPSRPGATSRSRRERPTLSDPLGWGRGIWVTLCPERAMKAARWDSERHWSCRVHKDRGGARGGRRRPQLESTLSISGPCRWPSDGHLGSISDASAPCAAGTSRARDGTAGRAGRRRRPSHPRSPPRGGIERRCARRRPRAWWDVAWTCHGQVLSRRLLGRAPGSSPRSVWGKGRGPGGVSQGWGEGGWILGPLCGQLDSNYYSTPAYYCTSRAVVGVVDLEALQKGDIAEDF